MPLLSPGGIPSVRPLPKVPWPSLDFVPVPERAPLLLADVFSYFNFWSVPIFAPLMSNDTLRLLGRARVRTPGESVGTVGPRALELGTG